MVSTQSKEEDTNTARPREDDESSNGREDEPAQVCSKKDETVAVSGEVNLAGQPRVSCKKVKQAKFGPIRAFLTCLLDSEYYVNQVGTDPRKGLKVKLLNQFTPLD